MVLSAPIRSSMRSRHPAHSLHVALSRISGGWTPTNADSDCAEVNRSSGGNALAASSASTSAGRVSGARLLLSTLIEHFGRSMARSNGRWGRLRRVLNEDLSNSTAVYTGTDVDRTPGDTPRYGAGANIENHPQVTDYVPRRFRVTALMLAGGATLGLIAETVARSAESIGSRLGIPSDELTLALSDRLVSWAIALTLLVTAAYARIIFLLKRHRLDDLRGRYRVWRQAALLAMVFSVCFVTSGHTMFARAAGQLTGIRPMDSDAMWWLVPTAILAGGVVVRLIRDAAECRLALTSFVLAAASFTCAATSAIGWSPVASQIAADSLSRTLPLASCLLALAGTLLTARYVVLDVQGLIEHPIIEIKSIATRAAHSKPDDPVEDSTDWTDGSEPDADYDDDRPLTKAERKRLRKQHGRYRAA